MKAIMVMFDSLNRRMLQPYGCDWAHTPNFLRLAERSVQFNNSYVGSMPCMPARRELRTRELRTRELHTQELRTRGLLSLGFQMQDHGFLLNPKPRDSNPWQHNLPEQASLETVLVTTPQPAHDREYAQSTLNT